MMKCFMLTSAIALLMATPRMQCILALPYRLHTDTFHTHKTSIKVYVYTCIQSIAALDTPGSTHIDILSS